MEMEQNGSKWAEGVERDDRGLRISYSQGSDNFWDSLYIYFLELLGV